MMNNKMKIKYVKYCSFTALVKGPFFCSAIPAGEKTEMGSLAIVRRHLLPFSR